MMNYCPSKKISDFTMNVFNYAGTVQASLQKDECVLHKDTT